MWRSIGAKAKGAAHADNGTPCQDAFASVGLSPTLSAVAVADGAGSARWSKSGSEIAVERAVLYLQNVSDVLVTNPAVWPAAVRGAFEAARGALMDFGRSRRIDPRQLATTLQVALLGDQACCYGRIGDGGGVGRSKGALIPLAPAPRNTYANETTFLTSAGAEPEVFFHASHLSDCAFFTDGLQHLAMRLSEWTPHAPFFSPLFDFARSTADVTAAQDSLRTYLGTDKFNKRTDDDRTLVISVWTEDVA